MFTITLDYFFLCMNSGMPLQASIPFGRVSFPACFFFLAALINKARIATSNKVPWHEAARPLSLAKAVPPFFTPAS